MNPLTWLRRRRAATAARSTYYEHQRQIGRLNTALALADDPRDRAMLLFRLGRIQLDQANVRDLAWGVEQDPDGTDAAQALRWAACLYRLLAYVEQAAAYPGHGRRERMAAILGEESDGILDLMAGKVLLGDRMALLPELRRAVVANVGVRAADVVANLPYPDGRLVG